MNQQSMDILHIMLEAGIVVKLVLLLLFVASVISWTIFFKKRKVIGTFKNKDSSFLNFYKTSSNLKEIIEGTQDYSESPLRNIFQHGYGELIKIKESFEGEQAQQKMYEHFRHFGMEALERALKKGVEENNKRLDESLNYLASIGSVTPFVGLFGTVWGIIDSFTGLAAGGATLDAVAPGIAEALVATAIGLFAAIPAVLFYNYFNNINAQLNRDMEVFEQDFLNTVERSLVA